MTRCQLEPHFQRTHWLHGRISRTEAEEILEAEHKVGAFIIRESTNPIGDYSLSF